MNIRKHKDTIELVAENSRETKLLLELFGSFGGRYRAHSMGYDRKMPKRKRGGKQGIGWWVKRQVLVFTPS